MRYAEGLDVAPKHDAAYWEKATRGFDFSGEDRAPFGLFNEVVWQGMMDGVPYPTGHSGKQLGRTHKIGSGGGADRAELKTGRNGVAGPQSPATLPHRRAPGRTVWRDRQTNKTDKSFLVLFFKKELSLRLLFEKRSKNFYSFGFRAGGGFGRRFAIAWKPGLAWFLSSGL